MAMQLCVQLGVVQCCTVLSGFVLTVLAHCSVCIYPALRSRELKDVGVGVIMWFETSPGRFLSLAGFLERLLTGNN